jgi:hypothetical protein
VSDAPFLICTAQAALLSSKCLQVALLAEIDIDDLNYVAMHRAIYAARPDVGGIVQGHTPHARAFAMGDRELEMIVQGISHIPNHSISRARRFAFS